MFYLLDVMKVQWLPLLTFLVYTATPKNPQNNGVYTFTPAATKKRHVAAE